MSSSRSKSAWVLRHELRAGDVGRIIEFHGAVYARECGFDLTFEAYVARPLAEFVIHRSPDNRLWMAECNGELVGCIAIVGAVESGAAARAKITSRDAQLRWFLVHPAIRRRGLGRLLLNEAIQFAKDRGYSAIFLWTVAALADAARLYRSTGFSKVEEKTGRQWGVDVLEEKHVLRLASSQPPR